MSSTVCLSCNQEVYISADIGRKVCGEEDGENLTFAYEIFLNIDKMK